MCILAGLCFARVSMAADAIPGEQYCAQPISAITFSGNKITKEAILLREMDVEPGDACSLDDIIHSVQNIMDLGLFKSVRAELLQAEKQLSLHILIEEKYYFFAIPRFSRTSDAQLRAGLQLRWDNFSGRLHTLRLTSERREEDDGEGAGGFVHRLSYDVPRFLGSQHGFSMGVASERRSQVFEQNMEQFGSGDLESQFIELQVSRWISNEKGVQGWRYFTGLRVEHRNLTVREGTGGPFVDGVDVSLRLGFENKRVHQDTFRRRGKHYGVSVTTGSQNFGSDFSYSRYDLFGIWYLPLPNGQRNLNIKARFGISDGAPFGEKAYHVGGGELLRGLDSNTASGDMQALFNIEYKQGFFAYPLWRWVAFADIGNVHDRNEFKLIEQKVGLGFGLRRKIASLTNTDLRIDFAWDADRRRVQTYVSTNLTF